MQEFSTLNGFAVKDAEARARIAELEEKGLSDDQRVALRDLARAYQSARANFKYEFSPNRNAYASASTAYAADGRAIINCSLLCQLVWAGISPDTFVGKKASYSGDIVKAFDWGYLFRFFNRRISGATNSDGTPFNFVKPNADSYEGSYSWNSYYSEGSTRADKQAFKSYMDAADMAQELYMMGCEIPVSEARAGDIVFFRASHLNDGKSDGFQESCFRNIGHCAIVSGLSTSSGRKLLGFVHSTDYLSDEKPIINTGWDLTSKWDQTYYAVLENSICMVARHPSAYGITRAVGDKFTTI